MLSYLPQFCKYVSAAALPAWPVACVGWRFRVRCVMRRSPGLRAPAHRTLQAVSLLQYAAPLLPPVPWRDDPPGDVPWRQRGPHRFQHDPVERSRAVPSDQFLEVPFAAGPETTPAASPAPAAEPAASSSAQAVALVQAFYQRFHGLPEITPTAKELAQATTLLTRHGPARAHFLLTYAREAATATDYHPQTFMGILHYLPRALAAFATRRAQAAARQAAAAERTRHEQYAQRRQQTLAQLRAALPEGALAALEAAQQVRLLAEGTAACALPLAVRIAVDEVLATQARLPECATWHAQQA